MRIRSTAFDLTGGLQGEKGGGGRDAGKGRRFIFHLGATPRRKVLNRLIPITIYKPAKDTRWPHKVDGCVLNQAKGFKTAEWRFGGQLEVKVHM